MGDRNLKIRHSAHFQEPAKSSTNSDVYSKSDLNVAISSTRNDDAQISVSNNLFNQGEYYKRYEHDEVPVKDSSTDESKYTMPKKTSLTNSDLQKMETRIFNNVSQELQTDDASLSSLGSNIKFFKTTVQKIFDNFYTSMRDFEHYKKRFNDILAKNKEGSVDDMEDFIRDMFDHIMSSNNSGSNISCAQTNTLEHRSEKETVSSAGDTYTEPNTSTDMLAYKNENYLTDSTVEDLSKGKSSKIEEIFSIFLLGDPYVQVKINDRNLFSEINIRETEKLTTGAIASADNLKTLAAKRLEVERYIKQQNHNIPDRDIPVKISYAKKNIYLNEDFARNENRENSKSLIAKICNILCKKFRKSSFG